MTPSPGIRVFSMPKSRLRWTTKGSSSKKDPGSSSLSMRSCAESLPSRCCLSMRSAPPPRRAFSRSASSSSIFFSRLTVLQDDSPLLGELAADPAKELLPVHATGGDLVAGVLHHAARLLVEGPLLLRLVGQGGEHRLTQDSGGPLLEELPRGKPPSRSHRDEFLLRIREAHRWEGC